jgi:hypothetical protein
MRGVQVGDTPVEIAIHDGARPLSVSVPSTAELRDFPTGSPEHPFRRKSHGYLYIASVEHAVAKPASTRLAHGQIAGRAHLRVAR